MEGLGFDGGMSGIHRIMVEARACNLIFHIYASVNVTPNAYYTCQPQFYHSTNTCDEARLLCHSRIQTA